MCRLCYPKPRQTIRISNSTLSYGWKKKHVMCCWEFLNEAFDLASKCDTNSDTNLWPLSPCFMMTSSVPHLRNTQFLIISLVTSVGTKIQNKLGNPYTLETPSHSPHSRHSLIKLTCSIRLNNHPTVLQRLNIRRRKNLLVPYNDLWLIDWFIDLSIMMKKHCIKIKKCTLYFVAIN